MTDPDHVADDSDALGEPLVGGLEDGRVFRVGDTVRKPAGPWTETLHALLRHLQARGFPCPRPLGRDSRGREMLSFLPGQASLWPWPTGLLATDGCRKVGQLLRAYHEAVADFVPPAPAVWRHGPQELRPGEIVLHGDFAPYNLVWQGGELTGVIDFELARPGLALEDAAFAAIRLGPLRPDQALMRIGFPEGPDRRARLAAFAAGYGCDLADLVRQIPLTQAAELARITGWGGEGREPWATFLARGLDESVRLEGAWMATHRSEWATA
ncbi:phosphotransferase enzyme family protein [Caulobacter sp. KR2-114]|uniref:phosphotransferase enzyme family protein n=1 Tax=Caulobacter sp. KR2-114 TaxID=3400912 RepID=UPI003BFFF85A